MDNKDYTGILSLTNQLLVLFSINITLLIYNITLVVKIKYGSMPINKITFRPYYACLFILIAAIFETVGYLLTLTLMKSQTGGTSIFEM